VSLHPNCKKHLKKVPRLTQNTTCKHVYLRRGLTRPNDVHSGNIQGTFDLTQGTFGLIQATGPRALNAPSPSRRHLSGLGSNLANVKSDTGVRAILRNPENKKLLTLLGRFTLTSPTITVGQMTSTLRIIFFRSLLSDENT
jgi:hypothetical protein